MLDLLQLAVLLAIEDRHVATLLALTAVIVVATVVVLVGLLHTLVLQSPVRQPPNPQPRTFIQGG